MRQNITPSGVRSADFFDGYAFRAIQKEMTSATPGTNGLYNYYEYRLREHAGGLREYEGVVATYIRDHVPAATPIVHVAIGMGTTTALLALFGFQVVGIEADIARAELAGRFRTSIIQAWPAVEDRYTLIHGLFPAALSELPAGFSIGPLALFTNFGADLPEAVMADILAALPRFATVILDLRLFGAIRETAEARDALRDSIVAQGLRDAGPVPSAPSSHYWRFGA